MNLLVIIVKTWTVIFFTTLCIKNNGHVCIIFIVNLRDWCLSCWYCVYIIICHMQVKIGLICQNPSSPVGHMKYVSDVLKYFVHVV